MSRGGHPQITTGTKCSSQFPSHLCGSPVYAPGRGLDAYVARIPSLPSGSVQRVLALGNSVARWNNAMTSHAFARRLQSCFPWLRFTVDLDNVAGGFGASHELSCGRSHWQAADIILVHYAELASSQGGRQLLEGLLQLGQRALVVVIKHCGLVQLEVSLSSGRVPKGRAELDDALWFQLDKHHTSLRSSVAGVDKAVKHAEWQARCEREDAALVQATNISFVDSCALLRAQLPAHLDACTKLNRSSTAAGGKRAQNFSHEFKSLVLRMFPYNPKSKLADPLHPAPGYCELQGTAAAELVSGAYYTRLASRLAARPSASMALSPLPPAALEAHQPRTSALHGHAERSRLSRRPVRPSWCWLAASVGVPRSSRIGSSLGSSNRLNVNVSLLANTGWQLKTGGAGGKKQWLHASSIGAFLSFAVPVISPWLYLEYYKHDTLPLGLLQADVAWMPRPALPGAPAVPSSHRVSVTSYIDGRCTPADHCPTGQGFYHRAIIAEFGADVQTDEALVRLTVVPRLEQPASATKETDFSIVSLINEPYSEFY